MDYSIAILDRIIRVDVLKLNRRLQKHNLSKKSSSKCLEYCVENLIRKIKLMVVGKI